MLENPFNKPQFYRNEILKYNFLNFPKKKFEGKSLACVFLTRFCSVGCSFCFNQSQPSSRKQNIEDQFSEEGIEKLIDFAQKANLGYLLVSGGGEPFNKVKELLQIVEKIKSDRIVLVTSGNWAKNYKAAENYIEKIYNAFKKRLEGTHLVIRISISDFHAKRLGTECAVNILNVFKKRYRHEKKFTIQVKSFEGDRALNEFLSQTDLKMISEEIAGESDNDILEKIIPQKQILTFENDYEIPLGISRIFDSSIKPNLNNSESLTGILKTTYQDLTESERKYPSVVYNQDGTYGLNWSINYNGNICLWQNQTRDTYQNLYEDDYGKIINTYFNDSLTYSFLDKGDEYRDSIINEVSPITVLRAKAMGLRDKVGTILFEEEKTRLYYTIRVIQDYIKEKKIVIPDKPQITHQLHALLSVDKNDLVQLYKNSEFGIVQQEITKPFSQKLFYDFLELVKLGHYDLTSDKIKEAINFYNKNASHKIDDLGEILEQSGLVNERLADRLMYIKEQARFYTSL